MDMNPPGEDIPNLYYSNISSNKSPLENFPLPFVVRANVVSLGYIDPNMHKQSWCLRIFIKTAGPA